MAIDTKVGILESAVESLMLCSFELMVLNTKEKKPSECVRPKAFQGDFWSKCKEPN